MKNIKLLFLVIFASLISIASLAQKQFQGTISYKIEMEGEDIDEATKAQAPSFMALNFGDSRYRFDMNLGNIASIGMIVDYKTKDQIILADVEMFGVKWATKATAEDIEKRKQENNISNEDNIQINYINETKTIAGYKCKKAEVVSDNGEVTELFYTEEIVVPKEIFINENFGLKKFDFVIMEITSHEENVTVKITATNVNTKKPKSTLFSIPEDYEMKTLEEMSSMGLF